MKRYISEFIGTFCLVFAGTGAVIINDTFGGVVSHPGIAIVFGLVVMSMIYSIGDISGAHINPAVTIGFYRLGLFSGRDVLPYIICQVIGAVAASGVLLLMFPNHKTLGATLPNISILGAFIFEVILTFMLMFVIVHVSEGAKEKGLMAGVAVGGMVGLEAMFAGPATGASMNPARSIGPAVMSGNLPDLWIYIVAPIIGVLLACWTCRAIRGDRCCMQDGDESNCL